MSILGFELFRRITHSEGKEDPAEILNEIDKEFINFFNDQENINLRDGMDITVSLPRLGLGKLFKVITAVSLQPLLLVTASV